MAAKKKVAGKAVATKQDNALITGGAIDFAADSGAGMEGTDSDSFAIPFLRPVQKLSPVADESRAEFREDAKPGMFINSVTGQLYDGKTDGVIFLPCSYQRRFLLWAPRGADRGFMGEFTPEQVASMQASGEIVESDGRLYEPDEQGRAHEKCARYVDTRSHFGLVLEEDGTTSQVLLAISSTQVKRSKQLMMMLQSAKLPLGEGGKLVTPPTWMNKIRLKTTLESNDQGSWYGLSFAPEGAIDDPDVYHAGKAFHEAISQGVAGANHAAGLEDEDLGDAGAGGKF